MYLKPIIVLIGLSTVIVGETGSGASEGPPAWGKPVAPKPKPFRMGKVKVKKPGPIREPKEEPPLKLFPVADGRKRANSIRWVSGLINDTSTLVYSARRLKNGCRMTRRDWRRKQSNGMADSPLLLPMRPVNGSKETMVTLPIEKMGKLKTYNRTIFRAYVDEDAWKAENWFMCGYPGAERFKYHAFDINDLQEGYPKFVKWKTGGIWNESGMIQIKGMLGAGSHVVFHKGGQQENNEGQSGSGSGASEASEARSGSGSGDEKPKIIEAIDFASVLMATVKLEDYVVVKIDIENAEFRVLDKMFATGAINLVDEMFIECHGELTREAYTFAGLREGVWVPEAWVRSVACRDLEKKLRKYGIFLHEWD